MKNYYFIVPGGGIFSRILQFGIIPLADIEFDKACLQVVGFAEADDPNDDFCRQAYEICCNNLNDMEKYGIINPYLHITGYALDQYYDQSFQYGGYLPQGTLYSKQNPIEESLRFQDYKRVLGKLRIQQDIHNHVNEFVRDKYIGENTLGIHVRLTTMNMLHHDIYQKITCDDYINAIKKEFDSGQYSNMFVASDNHESIMKLKKYFGSNVISHDNFIRFRNESFNRVDECLPEYDWFYQKKFWQESFRDCMVLSRCGALVCRESNFSNMAIVFSDSFKKITRVFNE
jgi:hypothetical protein